MAARVNDGCVRLPLKIAKAAWILHNGSNRESTQLFVDTTLLKSVASILFQPK